MNLPSFIVGLREGLEAFLLIAIIVKYLNKMDQQRLTKQVIQGSCLGLILSSLLGYFLYFMKDYLGNISIMGKVWESIASLIAVFFISGFIVWMIRHGTDMSLNIKKKINLLSPHTLFWTSFVIILREGVEIALFSFAGRYPLFSLSLGILTALSVAIFSFLSLIKINLSLLFNITLLYLILQCSFLLGYSVHEGLSALKNYLFIPDTHFLLIKAFDLSKTIFDHKNGLVGLPLHVLFGWYSKPEWIQFILQILFSGSMITYWKKCQKSTNSL